jgi:hypothetical protein
MYINFADIDKTGLSNQRRALHRFLNRNSLVAKPGSILCLQNPHCVSGYRIPNHRLCCHW